MRVTCQRCRTQIFRKQTGYNTVDAAIRNRHSFYDGFEPSPEGWEIKPGAGGWLCPQCVKAFDNVIEDFLKGVAADDAKEIVDKCTTVDAVEVPPIKVGDTAYFIIHGKIYKAEVYLIRREHHKRYGMRSEISASVGQYSSVGASFDDFGKTVFLTEEEAEAALAKMDGGNEDANTN